MGLLTGKFQIDRRTDSAGATYISFDSSIIEALVASYKKAIIVRPLEIHIRHDAQVKKLSDLWKNKGLFQVTDLPRGFYVVIYDREEDAIYSLTEGPWIVHEHYLSMREWSVDFDPNSHRIETTLVWVRIIDIPLIYYKETTVRVIGQTMGEPNNIYSRTVLAQRGKFSRISAHINLSKQLQTSLTIDGKSYALEYENLHSIVV